MTELIAPDPAVRERPESGPCAGLPPLHPTPGDPGTSSGPQPLFQPEPLSRRLLIGARAWLGRHAISLPLILGLLALAWALIGTGIGHYPAFSDDEGTYTAEAWAAITHGSLSHYTYWYDHPPLGWIQLGILTWLAGGLGHGIGALAAARSVMLVPALATVGLLYVLERRLGLRRTFAALGVLLLIGSPLGLTSLREVYLENFALPWVLAGFILAASPSRRLWAFGAAGVCFAISVLSKETMLLFLPGLVVLLVQRSDRRTRSFCLAAFGVAFLLVLFAYPLYATLKGELLPGAHHVSLEQAVVWQLSGRAGSGSIFSSGSLAHRVLRGWTAVDPWLLVIGLASLPVGLFIRRLRGVAVAQAGAIVVAIHGGYLPEPFDIGLLPFFALLAAGAIDAAWGMRGRHGLPRARGAACPWIRSVAVAGAAAALAALVAPGWVQGDAHAMRANATASVIRAERYIERHVPTRARLMIDDTMYVDLVNAGFRPRYGVVWFYKLGFGNNLDPAIVRHLPRGWKEFDYVVSTPAIRSALSNDGQAYAQVRDALRHSRTVAAFGSGTSQIQIRRIVGANTGSGFLGRAGGGS